MRNRYRNFPRVLFAVLLLGGCSGGAQDQPEQRQEAAERQEAEQEGRQEEPEEAAKEEVSTPVYIAEGIRKLRVTVGGEEILQISYEPREYESSYEYWKIRIPYGEEAIVDTEAMLKLYHYAEALDFANAAAVPEGCDSGLEGSETAIALEFCQTNQEERAAAVSGQDYEGENSPSYQPDADSSYTLVIGNSNGEGYYYAALETNPEQVILVPEASVNAILNVDSFGLILKIGAAAEVGTVEQITIDMDETSYQITAADGKYQFEKKELEEADYHTLYTELLSVLIADEITAEQPAGEEMLLRLYFKRNIEGAADLEIIYHAYDEDYASVQINGVEKLLVKKEDVEHLKEIVRNL